ncbi:MAG: hypothetical protein HYT94_00435 [Parcubacteria group bacterium]|nr:hypothetical protein [Parcubacteria group bacterium]
MKHLSKIPVFPENTLNLKRGTVLKVKDPFVTKCLGLKIGQMIPIGYDGEHVCSQGLGWTLEQIIEEIAERQLWEIVESIDLSDKEKSLRFAREIECVELLN